MTPKATAATTAKVSKFVATLTSSNDGIKQQRANSLKLGTELEAKTLVQNLTRELLTIRNQIDKLSDLGPTTIMELTVGGVDFDATKWVKEMHDLKLDERVKVIELEAAEELYNEWFGETAEATEAAA